MIFLNHTIIIDDFYQDPEAVYEMLQGLPTEAETNGNYGGRMSLDTFFSDGHQSVLNQITGERLSPSTPFNGKIRFSMKNERGSQHIHFDPGNDNRWAGVCYLQKPEFYDVENTCGTIFWKHKRTGLTSVPLSQEGIEKHGWHTVEDLKLFLETDGVDESLWEKTLSVPYRFNRLVLFRPWLFHSPGDTFGDSHATSRIVQTFFLGPEKQ